MKPRTLVLAAALARLLPHPPNFTPIGAVALFGAALPFFHGTLLGDAFFSAALFGGFALAEKYHPALRPAPFLA